MRKYVERIDNANFGSYTSKILCNTKGVNRVLKYMFDPSFWEKISQSVTNFDNNAVISLYVTPISLLPLLYKRLDNELKGTVVLMRYVNILDCDIELNPDTTSTNGENCVYIDPRIYNKAIYGGSVYIAKQFGGSMTPDYLDYSPYTKVQINIPFVGLVDVETNLVMGRYIDLWYTLDLETMTITAYVYSRASGYRLTIDDFNKDVDENYLVAKFSAPFGAQIALNGENRGQMMQNTLSSFGSVVGDIATIPMTGGMSAIKLAGDINSTLHPAKSFTAGVSGAGYNNFFDSPIVQAYVTRPVFNSTQTSTNSFVNGYACEQTVLAGGLNRFIQTYRAVLSNAPGYYKYSDIDAVQGIDGATGDEVGELNEILRSGFYYVDPEGTN